MKVYQVFCFAFFLLFSVLSYSKPSTVLPAGVKYKIVNIDGDLTQTVNIPGYINRDQFVELVQLSIYQQLQEADMLSEKGNTDSAELEVFVDYLRTFVGDQSPFPTRVVRDPKIRYHIAIRYKDEVVFNGISPKLTMSSGSFLFGFETIGKGVDNKKDLEYLFSSAMGVVDDIKRVTPDPKNLDSSLYKKEKNKSLKNVVLFWLENRKLKNNIAEINEDLDYIPESVTTDYLSRLSSSDVKDRIAVYKEIFLNFVNSDELNSYIADQISMRSSGDLGKKEDSELAWAIKALASSGLEKYKPVLEKAVKEGSKKKVVKHAKSSLKEFDVYIGRASVVHSEIKGIDGLIWYQRQLLNMLRSDDKYLRNRAVKVIYNNYKNDMILLDEAERILKEESVLDSFRASSNEDFYSWLSRLIGSSSNKKYLPTLKFVEQNATSDKVKEYAKKYYNILSNTK